MDKHRVVAELAMTNRRGEVSVVQVHADASFLRFYTTYRQVGVPLWSFNRNFNLEGGTVSLEQIPSLIDRHCAFEWQKIEKWKVNYPDRALYGKMLSTPPDELGEGLTPVLVDRDNAVPLWEAARSLTPARRRFLERRAKELLHR